MPQKKAVSAPKSVGAPAEIVIDSADSTDLKSIVRLDALTTGNAKPKYWKHLLEGSRAHPDQQFFLVARKETSLTGFIVGEIRAWEFGSPPCGWVFAIAVDPDHRLGAVGSRLFDAVCQRFRKAGVTKVRTMIARDSQLIMSFFRSQGMMAGPFIELEKDLDE
ncbi:MAG: GNAT family N-acetyltransferase [Rhodovulum sp.]|nr:GNAT family N-acetyltransferase [Rhodovulum sp.]